MTARYPHMEHILVQRDAWTGRLLASLQLHARRVHAQVRSADRTDRTIPDHRKGPHVGPVHLRPVIHVPASYIQALLYLWNSTGQPHCRSRSPEMKLGSEICFEGFGCFDFVVCVGPLAFLAIRASMFLRRHRQDLSSFLLSSSRVWESGNRLGGP